MKSIKVTFAALLLAIGITSVGTLNVATAAGPLDQICSQTGDTENAVCKNKDDKDADSTIKLLINILLYVVGAVATVMLIWAGIRFVTSAGNPAAIISARKTIMYSIIGLVIAFLAYAIVNFVITDLF